MGDLEPKKSITERVPLSAMKLVQAAEGDIDLLLEDFEFEYPEIQLSRDDARKLIRHCVLEKEADELATAPSSVEFLLSQADKMLAAELDRLQHEQRIYTKIANADPNQDYKITVTGEIISPEEAHRRLSTILTRLLEIKKALAEDVKAAAKEGGGGFNMQLNFGDVLTDAIGNIKSMGKPVKQVESVASRPAGEN